MSDDLNAVMTEHQAVWAGMWYEDGRPCNTCAADCQDEDGVSAEWPCFPYRLASRLHRAELKVKRAEKLAEGPGLNAWRKPLREALADG